MKILFEPSGTHIHKDILKVRLDLYPDKTDKSYAQNYVSVPVIPDGGYPGKVDDEGNPINQKQYDKWVESLPHIWQLNPCLSVFVRVDENITKALMTEFVGDVWKPDVLATIDNCMIASTPEQPHLSAHLISPYMRYKTMLSSAKTLSFDPQTKANIDSVLADFSIGTVKGKAERIEPESIDVGPGATDRTGTDFSNQTLVEKTNPANATGTLDTWELWFSSTSDNATNVEVATFYIVSGNNVSTRDYETLGTVAKGSKQTFTGLSTDVTTGDFAGVYYKLGRIETTPGGGSCLYHSGDMIPATNHTFSAFSYIYSIYATGTETPTGWANIKNLRMGTGTILATDLSSIWFGTTEVAVADIAEIGGVAV